MNQESMVRRRVNRSGQVFEKMITGLLIAARIEFRQQVPLGVSVFKNIEIHADFLLENLRDYPQGLIVACKWQDRPGSIDEKFLYLVESIKRAPMPTIVIADGGGARLGALDYLHSEVDGDRFLAVLTVKDFVSWILRAALR